MLVEKLQPSVQGFLPLLYLEEDPVGFHLLRFSLFFVVFDGGNDLLELHVAALYKLVGAVYYVTVKPQFLRYLEGVGLAGYSDVQSVGRAESLHVEFHGSVLHALLFDRELLQLVIVGGGSHAGLVALKSLEDGYCESRSFCGIGTCSQLVQEHQRTVACLTYELHCILHVRTEGRKTLLDGLLVPYVAKYFLVNGHPAG